MTPETQEQQQERISEHLEEIKERMEQIIAAPKDVMLKRIEVDAAMIATLAIVSELLPAEIQKQVKAIVVLHEKVWNMDTPAHEGETPRKPLTAVEHIFDDITSEARSDEGQAG